MGKVKKSTKLFQKKHLADTIDKRRKRKQMQGRKPKKVQQKKGKRAVRPADADGSDDDQSDSPDGAGEKEEVSLEDFLASFEGEVDFDALSGSDTDEAMGGEGFDDAAPEAESDEDDESDGDGASLADKAGDPALAAQHEQLVSDVSQHKLQLERLKETQPEFFKFLQEQDGDLLAFDDSSDDSEDEGGEGSGQDEGDDDGDSDSEAMDSDTDTKSKPAATTGGKKDKGKTVVTMGLLKHWAAGLEKHTRGALVSVVSAFTAACYLGVEDEGEVAAASLKYVVNSGKVFNRLMHLCLTRVLPLLDAKLPAGPGRPGRGPLLPSQCKGWASYKVPVKVYVRNLLRLATQMTDPSMVIAVLKSVGAGAPYFACYPKLSRALLKALLQIWSSADEEVRLVAFIVIRKLAIVCPYPFIDTCLKSAYMTFVRNCKFTNQATLPMITFMQSCVVELFQLDPAASYQHAFGYIRQLAVSLRNAISLKKKESHQQVYNWQFIHCIRVWARLLATSESEQLRQLIYPLVEVTLGTANLINTPRHFPLRFHCIEALVELGRLSGVYIPLSPLIFDTLASSEMQRKPKPDTGRPLLFEYLLKVAKQSMNTRHFQDAVMEQVFRLGIMYFSSLACSISFPELAYPSTLRLRAFLKTCKVAKFRAQLKKLLAKIEENRNFVSQRRAGVSFSPRDKTAVDAWEKRLAAENKSPLVRFCDEYLRTEEKQKRLEAGDEDEDSEMSAEDGASLQDDGAAADDMEGDDDGAPDLVPRRSLSARGRPSAVAAAPAFEEVTGTGLTDSGSDDDGDDDIVQDFELREF